MSSPRPLRHFSAGQPILENPKAGFWRRHLGTWTDICLRPAAFFSHLAPRAPFTPTGFAVFCVWLGTVLGTFWKLLAVESLWLTLQGASDTGSPLATGASHPETPAWVQQLLLGQEQMWLELPRVQNQLWTTLLLAPVVAYFTLHLVAGLLHFTLQPFRAAAEDRVPFEATFRFTAYAMAPMVLCGVPALGGIGGFWSWIVLGIAMARLHRLRWLGTVSSVWLPVLFLSVLWNQEILPRIAPPIAAGLHVAWENASPEEIKSKIKHLKNSSADAAKQEQEQAQSPDPGTDAADGVSAEADYPPMPAFDREHRVDTREIDGFWQSERQFDSSRGPLRIHHRARGRSADTTEVQIRVRHEGTEALALEIEHPPVGEWRAQSARAFISSDNAPPSSTNAPQSGRIEKPWTARFAHIEPGAQVIFSFDVDHKLPQDVLQVGPTLQIAAPGGVE